MKAATYFSDNFSYFVDEIGKLIRFKSISTDPVYKDEIKKTQEWVKQKFESLGFHVTVVSTTGSNPVLICKYIADPAYKTVLMYGHYDVQPVAPLDAWLSDPFTLTQREGRFFARGIMDNKGQFMMHVSAIEAMIASDGKLPINITFLVEGDEETGSGDLGQIISENVDLLKADFALISDGEMQGDSTPVIEASFRGVLNCELMVFGPKEDMHSGLAGGTIANPGYELSKFIASLYDENYHITIPHFYDKVVEITEEEKQIIAAKTIKEEDVLALSGAKSFVGEKGFSRIERMAFRPTIQVTGMHTGYIETGYKNVVPAKAFAKFNFRLVSNQNPFEIYRLFSEYVEQQMSPDVRYELSKADIAYPVKIDLNNEYTKKAHTILKEVYGENPEIEFVGGTLPIMTDIQNYLGIPILSIPLSQQDCGIHSPNERLLVDAFKRGVNFSIAFLSSFGKD